MPIDVRNLGGGSTAPPGERVLVVGSDCATRTKNKADFTGDGTAAGDTAALTSALALAGTHRIEMYGTFLLNDQLAISGVDRVKIKGDDTVIYTPALDGSTPALDIAGSRTAVTIAISNTTTTQATLAQGTNSITHTTTGLPSNLSPGDWVAFTVNVGWGARPGENFYSEWLQVESVTSTTLVFKTPFRASYLLNGSTYALYRYNLIDHPEVEGIRFVGPGGEGHPSSSSAQRERLLSVRYAHSPIISKCYAEGPYAREGLAAWECLRPQIVDFEIKDINDQAGVVGTLEAYGARIMGCEGALVERGISTSGTRHAVEVNGGQHGYGLSNNTYRPISYATTIRNIRVYKSWGAAVGDHPGAAATFFDDIYGNGCSGLIFVRGKRARVRNAEMVGGHQQNGPYASGQGNSHCITIGEQQRTTGGAEDVTTRDGWCGTDIQVDGVTHDMTGNGGTLGVTSHTIFAVHPLVRATINLGDGGCRPTGNVVHAIGQYNQDTEITGVVDCSSAFGSYGRGLYMVPAATTPAKTTGQQSSGIDVSKLTVINPRNPPIVIAGAVGSTTPSDRVNLNLEVQGLGSGLTSAGPAIVLAADANGATGYFGVVRLDDLELGGFAASTAIDQSNASVARLLWRGISRFASSAEKSAHVMPLGPWYQTAVSGTGGPTKLLLPGGSSSTGFVAATPGRVVGLSIVANTGRTAGTLTGEVYIAGAATGIQVQLDDNPTTQDYVTLQPSTKTFTPGQLIDVRYTTSGFTPTTITLSAFVFVEM